MRGALPLAPGATAMSLAGTRLDGPLVPMYVFCWTWLPNPQRTPTPSEGLNSIVLPAPWPDVLTPIVLSFEFTICTA